MIILNLAHVAAIESSKMTGYVRIKYSTGKYEIHDHSTGLADMPVSEITVYGDGEMIAKPWLKQVAGRDSEEASGE